MKAKRKSLKILDSTGKRFDAEKEARMNDKASADDFINHLLDKLPPLKVKTEK